MCPFAALVSSDFGPSLNLRRLLLLLNPMKLSPILGKGSDSPWIARPLRTT
jgi:hypothetical protein